MIEEDYSAVSIDDMDGVKKLLKFTTTTTLRVLADGLDDCIIPQKYTLVFLTQLIMRYFTNQIGAYIEFY